MTQVLVRDRHEMAYPFPLAGFMAKLILPADGLTEDEATRLKQYIDALVVEPLEESR